MALLSISLLREANFRRLAIATVLNSAGNMGETVVLGWLALELTNSPFMVGVAMGARMIPLFVVGVPAGVIADRLPRHRVLMATGAGQALTACAIGLLTVAGSATFGALVVLTVAAGIVRGLEHAARQGYAHDVTGAAELMNGLAVLGIAMRGGWLIGSLAAGALIAHFGSGAAYLGVAAAYVAGAAALIGVSRPSGDGTGRRGTVWQNVLDFAASLGRNRTLLALIVLTAGAEILGFSHQVLLPSLARDVLAVGPEGLGVMNAARSVGGILGLLAVSARPVSLRGGALFVFVLISFGASLVVLGLAPRYVGFAGVVLVLVVVNSAGGLADLLAQALMQLSVPASLRGRAGGAWVVAIGLAPLGHLQIGALASLFGVGIALGTSGLALIALATVTAAVYPRVRRL